MLAAITAGQSHPFVTFWFAEAVTRIIELLAKIAQVEDNEISDFDPAWLDDLLKLAAARRNDD